jgi:hypothetical protein
LPDFKVPTFDGKTSIVNKLAAGKYVLFSFWSLDSPPSLEFSKNVQQMYEKVKADHELQLISVCIGSEAEKGLEHVKKNSILGWHGHAKDWQHPILQDFGIRAIPSLCLADKNGKLLMSPYDFALATRQPESDLSKIVSDAITGKNKPTPKTAESEAEATTASRKN